MIGSIDFVGLVKEIFIKGLAITGISALTLISFAAIQLAVIILAFVQLIKHRSVLFLLQRLFRKTVLNISFHLVLAVALSVFLFVEIAWWWLPVVLFVATFLLFWVLKNTLVFYLNWKSRKYLKFIWLFNTVRKIRFIARA